MKVVQFALIGLGSGAIYALAAQGVVLVYRGSGVLNFASGAIGMLGAELFYKLRDQNGMDYRLALVIGLAVPAALSAVFHLVVMRRLRDATGLAKLIATLGLFAALLAIGLEIFGAKFRLAISLLPQDPIHVIGNTSVGLDRFILLGIVAALTAGLTVVYRFTTFGLATSAVAENRRATAALGRSPDTIAAVNWFLGGLLAGLAAILLAPIAGGPGLVVTDLSLLIIPALAAALVGSFASFTATFLGALVIGILESELSYFASRDDLPEALRTPGISKAVPFLVIVVVLVARGRALPLRDEAAAKPPEVGSGQVRPMVVASVLGAVLAMTWFVFDADWTDSLITTAVVGIVCLSLVVVTGFTGQVSLAQFTLAGMGAWAAVRLADAHSIPFEVALLVGAVGALPVGLLVALPSLRVRGVNLAVATLGMALALDYLVLQNVHAVQRNDFQILHVEPPSLFGIDINRIDHPARYATVVVVIFAVLMILVANLRRGRAGRRMIAVRTNERAAASLGISVFGAKLFAFGLGAALSGIGGVLLAFTTTAPTWNAFSVGQSINAVVYAVIGGVGFVIGPIFAGFFAIGSLGGKMFELLGNWVGVDLENIFQVVGGLGLISILLQDPNGLASQNIGQWRSMARRLHVDRAFRARPERPLPDVARSPVTPRPLEVRALGVRFGGVIALDEANVVVNPGEVVGLIGPNGAGKTTLIDAVTGFVRPSGGTVLLDGKPIGSLSARRRALAGIGRSFQSLELFEDMTVRDNLRTASEHRDRRAYLTDLVRPGDPPLSPTAVAAIREFGLEGDLDRRPGELPHGRRRLVGIARAIATAPSVLLLDEPAAGLDDHETAELGHLIRRLAREWGLAVLLVEHDVGLVLRVCDRIVVLDFGRIIAQGLPEEIRVDPAVVAAYLGVDSVHASNGYEPEAMRATRYDEAPERP